MGDYLLNTSTEILHDFTRFLSLGCGMWTEVVSLIMSRTGADAAVLKLPSESGVHVEAGPVSPVEKRELSLWASGVDCALTAELDIADRRWLGIALRDEDEAGSGYLGLRFDSAWTATPGGREVLHAALSVLDKAARNQSEIENARARVGSLGHLYEVGRAIGSTLDLDSVLHESASRVAESLGAEASTLFLVDETRRELVFKIPAGPAEQMLREQRMPMEKGIAGWAVTHGKSIRISDASSDQRFFDDIDRFTGYHTRSLIAVPLQVKGKTIGVIEVINKIAEARFTEEDEQWLSILAPLIAGAVENARLYVALREERDRIVSAEEAVRHELARSLHDGPAQILSAMILNIDVARRYIAERPDRMASELNYLQSLAEEANQEIRGLLFSLRPLILETHGLGSALHQLADLLRGHVPFELHLESCLPDDAIDTRVAGTIFVIIQEALNNIQKHAQARNVWIRLGLTDRVLAIEVSDDGTGFDVKRVEAGYARMNSFGLLNMRERARLIEGQLVIFSPRADGERGTGVRLEIPRHIACPELFA